MNNVQHLLGSLNPGTGASLQGSMALLTCNAETLHVAVTSHCAKSDVRLPQDNDTLSLHHADVWTCI